MECSCTSFHAQLAAGTQCTPTILAILSLLVTGDDAVAITACFLTDWPAPKLILIFISYRNLLEVLLKVIK